MAVYCTITAVSYLSRIDCHTVGSVCKRVYDSLEAEVPITRLDGIKRIWIDETSYRKDHKYLTVIVDHDNASLLWTHKEKSSKVLELFLNNQQKNNVTTLKLLQLMVLNELKKL